MEIELAEVRAGALELVEDLDTGVGHHARRPVVLVRLAGPAGEGWGECVALDEPTYAPEYAAGAVAVLADHLLPRLLAATPGPGPRPSAGPGPARAAGPGAGRAGSARPSFADPLPSWLEAALSALGAVRGHEMAKAAIEMALLDAWLSSEDTSLASFLGARAARVLAGATIGLRPDPAATLEAAGRAVGAGYRRLKVKVAPGRDLGPVGAVRSAFPDLAVVVDANGTYRFDDPDHRRALRGLDGLDLVAIEQPLAPDDLVGHAGLAAELVTPVLLDESVRSLGQLEAAAALEACDGVVVKPGPLGGLLAARRVHDRLAALGLHGALGGMLETGLARAGGLALAALEGFDLPGDLGASDRYFRPDLTDAHVLEDGWLEVPAGPGLGARPRPDRLGAFPVVHAVGRDAS